MMGNQEGKAVTTTIDVTTPPASKQGGGDERLAYRGVFQRLLIRPEIGASIGAIAIWIFFWAVATKFGTAGGTSSILDVAATLGIMAVAVSMLMIGGEFDLSAGSNTGAMGILTILLVKETGELGGAGLNLWIAIPISFAVALGIGYFNGTMVERTKLPSFIVTLGTFFVLKGAKLGFAKLIVGNVEVGRVDEGGGYETWRKIFAGEWARNGHQFSGRDVVYTIGMLGGMVLMVLATYEMHFKRREKRVAAGAVVCGVGTIAALAGVVRVANDRRQRRQLARCCCHRNRGAGCLVRSWPLAIRAARRSRIGSTDAERHQADRLRGSVSRTFDRLRRCARLDLG